MNDRQNTNGISLSTTKFLEFFLPGTFPSLKPHGPALILLNLVEKDSKTVFRLLEAPA
jgi:hypothetical protein